VTDNLSYYTPSVMERLVAEQCDARQIKWHKNTTEYFPFTNAAGKQSKYYPDFFLPEHNIWVEIKGLRYIRSDDDLRRLAVSKPVYLIISNRFKTELPAFFNNQCGSAE
jgi:hypothetical protein